MSIISNSSYLHQFSLPPSFSTSELFLMQPQPWLTNSSSTPHISKESLTIIPKTPAFVLGERLVQPVVSVISACFVSFNDVVSRMFNFPPGASATEVKRKDSCEDITPDGQTVIKTDFNPMLEVLSEDQLTQYAVVAQSLFNLSSATVLEITKDQQITQRIENFFNALATANIEIEKKSTEIKRTVSQTEKDCLGLYSTSFAIQKISNEGVNDEFFSAKKIYVLNPLIRQGKGHYSLHLNGNPKQSNYKDILNDTDNLCKINATELEERLKKTFLAYSVLNVKVISSLGQTADEKAFVDAFRNAAMVSQIIDSLGFALTMAFQQTDKLLQLNKTKALDPDLVEEALEKASCALNRQHEEFVISNSKGFTIKPIIVEGSKICYWEIFRNRGFFSRQLASVTPEFFKEYLLPDEYIEAFALDDQLVFRFRKGDIKPAKLEKPNTIH